jgi:hypothetical protein
MSEEPEASQQPAQQQNSSRLSPILSIVNFLFGRRNFQLTSNANSLLNTEVASQMEVPPFSGDEEEVAM